MERLFSHRDRVLPHPFAPVTPSSAAPRRPRPAAPHARATERVETPDLTRGGKALLILPGAGPGAAEQATLRRPGCSRAAQPKTTSRAHAAPASLPRVPGVTRCSLQSSTSLPGCTALRPVPCCSAPASLPLPGGHQEPPSARLPARAAAPTGRRGLKPAPQQSSALPRGFSRAGWELGGAAGPGASAIADAATTG